MKENCKQNRKNKLLKKLNKFGLLEKKGIKYVLFMLYLGLYKFARRKFFQIKELPGNLKIIKADKLRVLVHINGGLGDAICARNLLFLLRKYLPKNKVQIYLCCKDKEVFNTFFKEENLADFYISRGYFLYNFDLVLSGCTYLEYEKYNKEKIKKYAPKFLSVLEKGLYIQKKFNSFIKGDPYTDKLMTEKMISLNLNRICTPLLFAGFETKNIIPLKYQVKNDNALDKFNLRNKEYIVIHYENKEKPIKDFAPTRPWPKENWQEFIKLFKQRYPAVLLVQIGGHITLLGVDLCLCDKTNLKELVQIINGAICFMGGEGALAHLSGFLEKKSLVLYGPNSAQFLTYPNNTDLSAEVCDTCIWVTKTWRSACPLGYKTAPCMSAITPQKVLTALEEIL